MNRLVALVLTAVLFSGGLTAADREVVRTDWSGFQKEVSSRALGGQSARVKLTDGRQIRTSVLRATDSAMVVRATRATRTWDSGQSEASIPKGMIASVQFGGKTSNRRLIGLLAGLGGGAAIGAAIAAGSDVSEGAGIILIPAVGAAIAVAGGVVGYFAGKSADRPGPEFVLVP